MSEGTILKKYVKDGQEHAVIMLNINVVYLTLLNDFLDNIGKAEEVAKENKPRPKTLSINVAEDMSASGRFG